MKILNIVGARPNLMKIAPLIRAFSQHPAIEQCLIHTGQHYDDKLSKVFFSELGIPKPDVDLGVGSGAREEQIEKIMAAFEPELLRREPALIVVVGDVNSTIACARVAKKHGVKVAHVEAGLRSFDLSMPEEHNRIETDQLSDFLFVTEKSGMENLQKEGIKGKSFFVGNVMIDTLAYSLKRIAQSKQVSALGLKPKRYAVSTFHRPSNVDTEESLLNLLSMIEEISARIPLVLPLHPRTGNSLERFGLSEKLRAVPGLILTSPLGYFDFLKLVSDSRVVITDSGGIQEETTYLQVPCITMRENTERPVTLELETNVLVGMDKAKLIQQLETVLEGKEKPGSIPPLWDGRAAERIAEILVGASKQLALDE